MNARSSKPLALLAALALLAQADPTDQTSTLPKARPVPMPHANHHRIAVPTHRRLLDAIRTPVPHRHRNKLRHYEIEVLDESNTLSTLHLRQVKDTAVTPQTTYNFQSEWDGNVTNASNVLLAHRTEESMTILSVDPSGRVNGFHHTIMDGVTRHVTNFNDDGGLHVRSLQGGKNRKEWTCGAVSLGRERDEKSVVWNSTWKDGWDAVRNSRFKRHDPRRDGTCNFL
jgi:hypothetical protein